MESYLIKMIDLSGARIPVRVTNLGSQPTHLLLSHQEAFPVLSLDTSGTHVELVAGIQPTEVEQI